MNDKFKILAIDRDVADREEAIRVCADALEEAGYVDSRFAQAVLDREKEFPTGIASIKPVAIPHCKHDGIANDSICMLRTAVPVSFHRMEDPDETVEVHIIFCLAIKDSKEHLKVLQQLVALISNEEMLGKLESAPVEELKTQLETSL